jgi:hypothetical protein
MSLAFPSIWVRKVDLEEVKELLLGVVYVRVHFG